MQHARSPLQTEAKITAMLAVVCGSEAPFAHCDRVQLSPCIQTQTSHRHRSSLGAPKAPQQQHPPIFPPRSTPSIHTGLAHSHHNVLTPHFSNRVTEVACGVGCDASDGIVYHHFWHEPQTCIPPFPHPPCLLSGTLVVFFCAPRGQWGEAVVSGSVRRS
jgi:hypothetical protein